jgi:histone arginine demethylase JMJD6
MINTEHLQQLPRVKRPTFDEFQNEYALKSQPVVLEGVTDDWNALKKWTPEYLSTHFGDNSKFAQRTRNKHGEGRFFTVAEYFDYMKTTTDKDPYYLKDLQFHRETVLRNHYTVPEYFRSWLVAIPEDRRPFLSWFYLAAKDTISAIHLDIYNTSAWNVIISGKKLWLFYPQSQLDYLYDGLANPFEPNFDKFPYLAKAKPICCIQSPGEMVYTPSNWWHAVYNLEAGISLTENFVNEANYTDVLRKVKYQGLHQYVAAFESVLKTAMA